MTPFALAILAFFLLLIGIPLVRWIVLTVREHRMRQARYEAFVLTTKNDLDKLRESIKSTRTLLHEVTFGYSEATRKNAEFLKEELVKQENSQRAAISLIHQSIAKLDRVGLDHAGQITNVYDILRNKQDVLSEDEKFMEEAKFSNTINRVASHAGRKAAEERVVPQIAQHAENWLVKNVPSLEAVLRANFESIYKVTKRRTPAKVVLDQRNLDLGEEYKDLILYLKPIKKKAPDAPKSAEQTPKVSAKPKK